MPSATHPSPINIARRRCSWSRGDLVAKVLLMECPPADSADSASNTRLQRLLRRRHARLRNFNPLKRVRTEGESSHSSSSSATPPSPDGAKKTEAEAASEDPVVVTVQTVAPAPPWSARDPRCLVHGAASLMGRRRNMEDTMMEVTGLAAGAYGYFAVYDGHGGAMVAQACKDRLHVAVSEEVVRRRASGEREGAEIWKQAMAAAFTKVDSEILAEAREMQVGMVGSTAVAVVVAEEWILVANCGDSRAVLSRGGVAVPMSVDHKPDRPDELRRVEALGGKVICWDCPRVLGVLSTSRSFGDYLFKPYVSSDPEFMMMERSEEDEFIILASDGLWDVISSEMACSVIRRCLEEHASGNDSNGVDNFIAREAAGLLARLAICRGSFDNVSVMVVVL